MQDATSSIQGSGIQDRTPGSWIDAGSRILDQNEVGMLSVSSCTRLGRICVVVCTDLAQNWYGMCTHQVRRLQWKLNEFYTIDACYGCLRIEYYASWHFFPNIAFPANLIIQEPTTNFCPRSRFNDRRSSALT